MSGTIKRTHVIARRLGTASALVAVLMALAGMAGWAFDEPLLRTVVSGFASMSVNTALSLVLAGVVLAAASGLPADSRFRRRVQPAGAALVALLGTAVLVQYYARIDLGIDQLLAEDPFTPVELDPGRMSRAEAAGFVLFGFAVLFTLRRPKWSFWVGFALTAAGFWTALFVGVGYIFHVDTLYGSAWFDKAAMHTAGAFLALFIGMMLAVPERGWARIVLTDKLGGVVARRLLPVLALTPLVVLWASHRGQEIGLLDHDSGEFVAAVALLIVLTTVVLVMCGRLNVVDAHRRVINEARQRAQAASVRMRQIADLDPLTDLWSRRYFLERAQARINDAQAEGASLALLMLDVDHFKRINDTHGHAGGDRALQLLGATLKDFTRKEDCAARLGGEEFAVLLPDASHAVAQNIAERVCAQMARLVILDSEGRRFGITVSIGVTTLAETDRKPEDLLARADAALYEAKRAGRNRVKATPAIERSAA